MHQISDDQLASLEQAADGGDVSIQYLLGQMFENGLDVQQNLNKAAKLYQRAADANHVRAQNHLGWMYAEGRGVEKNEVLAAKWWNKAAAQNDSRALAYVRGTQFPISVSDLHDFVRGSMLNSIKDNVAEWALRYLKIAILFLSIVGIIAGGTGVYIFGELTDKAKDEIAKIVEHAQEALANIITMVEEAEESMKETKSAAKKSQLLLDKLNSNSQTEIVSSSEAEKRAPDETRKDVE